MFQTKLIDKKEIAEGTMLLRFEKPEGFAYKAGQSIDLTLVNPPQTDAEGNTRAYSIVAAPQEPALAIATRLRDTAFKRVLRDLPEGAPLQFDGPFGDFTLHEKASRPAVILAGGIGITPFHSMILDATERKLPHTIMLILSNRTPGGAPFIEELQALAKSNPNFTFVPTMTEMDASSEAWEGARGQITADMLKKHLPQGEPMFYLAGPAGMVKAMRDLLTGMGISSDDIRTEEFTGY